MATRNAASRTPAHASGRAWIKAIVYPPVWTNYTLAGRGVRLGAVVRASQIKISYFVVRMTRLIVVAPNNEATVSLEF